MHRPTKERGRHSPGQSSHLSSTVVVTLFAVSADDLAIWAAVLLIIGSFFRRSAIVWRRTKSPIANHRRSRDGPDGELITHLLPSFEEHFNLTIDLRATQADKICGFLSKSYMSTQGEGASCLSENQTTQRAVTGWYCMVGNVC